MKRKIIFTVIALVLVAGLIGAYFYFKPTPDVVQDKPDVSIRAKELVAASATPMILSILSRGETYGYAIIREIRDLSDARIQWTDGMLYPVLRRLEEQGLLESEWRVAESGRSSAFICRWALKRSGRCA